MLKKKFLKCLAYAFFCRFFMMPFQAWYYHKSLALEDVNMNILVCVPDSAGCVVSRTLPEILFASAFFVLLILYAQLIAAICGYPSFTSQLSPSNHNNNYHSRNNNQNVVDDRNAVSNQLGSMNRDRLSQQQLLASSTPNTNHHPNNNVTGNQPNIDPLDRSQSSSTGLITNSNGNGALSPPFQSNNAKYLLSCHERILLKLLYHKTTFSTTNGIMYSIYGICLFFSAIIPIMSFAQMQQILWIMLSIVYGTCLLVTIIWVLPSLYHQFYKKINTISTDQNNHNSHENNTNNGNGNGHNDQRTAKMSKQQKLFCKMWTSSGVCVFVYGGRTINFIWNSIFSMNGHFYIHRDGSAHIFYNTFFNTSLGRDAVLNLCFELIPACIIVGLMRYPTKPKPMVPPLPPVTTVIQHTYPSSSLTRSVSSRGTDQFQYHHHHSAASNNNAANARIFDGNNTGGMKRAVSAKAAVTTSSVSTMPSTVEHVPLLGMGKKTLYGTNAKNDDNV